MQLEPKMKYLSISGIVIFATSLILVGIDQQSFAHQSGCHSWHSCPSDSGSYTCGDKGYCSQCPDNQYCKAGNPRSYDEEDEYTGSDTDEELECKGTKLCIVGKVKRIIDGDTLVVDTYKIRLSLTNTPEKNESGFKEAKSFTRNLCPVGSIVTVDQDDIQPTDKYKRIVGKVICSDSILNAELLYYDHAEILTQYCKKSEFSSESWAKKYGC
jgi:hypothetical protein